jgi:hypothetical protein
MFVWRRLHSSQQRLIALVLLACLCIAAGIVFFVTRVDAVRFAERGLYINTSEAGATTWYELSLDYTTTADVGSVRMEFCDNPIPSLPCTVPAGLNLSGATLGAQTGPEPFEAIEITGNIMVMHRTPSQAGPGGVSTYRLDNVVNPTTEGENFYIRLTSHADEDALDPLIDYGSVANAIVQGTDIYTQVSPILIFCVAKTVSIDCVDTDENLVDFGDLNPGEETYATTSEMAARTNGRYGYNIYLMGTSFTSGVREVPPLTVPTESFVGVGQFGMNMTTNTNPGLGADPVGPAPIAPAPSTITSNITLHGDYMIPDHFTFRNGDLLASSTYVTAPKHFTSTYVLNIPADQAPGHYSTTLTYVCLAGF